MVICLERDADLHMAQLMPLPLTVSCFSKIQIGRPGKRAVKRMCVCVVKLSELINYRRKKRVSLCVNSSLMTVNYQSLQHRLEQGAERKSQNITVAVTTHLFSGPFSRTTQVRCYQKGKTDLDFTERRDSEWQWHQLGYILQR